MHHHVYQPFSKVPTHSEELQLAEQNKRLTREILHFEVKHYQHQDELNILLKTAKQLKYHSFARKRITSFTNCFSFIFG